MNRHLHASLAGWNASARSCRENELKFYYSYLGYKADVGEWEVVRYCVEHRDEVLDTLRAFLTKSSPNQARFKKAAKKPAKPKPKLAAIRKAAILNSQLDRALASRIARED